MRRQDVFVFPATESAGSSTRILATPRRTGAARAAGLLLRDEARARLARPGPSAPFIRALVKLGQRIASARVDPGLCVPPAPRRVEVTSSRFSGRRSARRAGSRDLALMSPAGQSRCPAAVLGEPLGRGVGPHFSTPARCRRHPPSKQQVDDLPRLDANCRTRFLPNPYGCRSWIHQRSPDGQWAKSLSPVRCNVDSIIHACNASVPITSSAHAITRRIGMPRPDDLAHRSTAHQSSGMAERWPVQRARSRGTSCRRIDHEGRYSIFIRVHAAC